MRLTRKHVCSWIRIHARSITSYQHRKKNLRCLASEGLNKAWNEKINAQLSTKTYGLLFQKPWWISVSVWEWVSVRLVVCAGVCVYVLEDVLEREWEIEYLQTIQLLLMNIRRCFQEQKQKNEKIFFPLWWINRFLPRRSRTKGANFWFKTHLLSKSNWLSLSLLWFHILQNLFFFKSAQAIFHKFYFWVIF